MKKLNLKKYMIFFVEIIPHSPYKIQTDKFRSL